MSMATNTSQSTLSKYASNEDLGYISQCIGSNWGMLAPFLLQGDSSKEVNRIKRDVNHHSTLERVHSLLLTWRRQTNDKSMAHLFHLMYKAGSSITIEWRLIAEKLGVQLDDVRACRTNYQPSPRQTQPGQNKPKDSCKFDGRLIKLNDRQIDYLESTLERKTPVGEGGFGVVYQSNDSTLFGIPVVVKEILVNGSEKYENHIRRERMVCRLMHPFILPLLAYVEIPNEKVWFISPFCENGDLHAAIKNGILTDKKINIQENINEPRNKRMKILMQIALAIQYIHTEIPGVRDSILHKDIASKNVVLDKYLNARLIDFGLAREGGDVSSGTPCGRKYYEHHEKGTNERAKKSWDYFSFGVIIRELLTNLEPEGIKGQNGPLYLKEMDNTDIERNIDKTVWETTRHKKLLIDLSEQCLDIKNRLWNDADFEKNVVKNLKNTYTDCCLKFYENDNNNEKQSEGACHQCIINPIAKESSLRHEIANCRQQIKVCMACEKNTFLNPITCYCGVTLASTIGSKWGALLVAGDDDDKAYAEAMRDEIKELERVITSQAPRIIGISASQVKVVLPDDTKTKHRKDANPAWKQIQEHIDYFSKAGEIDTLLVYFSCHGEEHEGKFRLGKKDTKLYVTLDEFQKELNKLKNIDRMIVFLDRCYPPMLELGREVRNFVQINACSDDKGAYFSDKRSMLTKFVLQGLKARSEGECSKDCTVCPEYWDTATEYISIFALFEYIRKHIEQENKKREIKKSLYQAPDPDLQMKRYWKNIAFFTDEEVEIDFTASSRGSKPIPLKYLRTFEDVKNELFKAFNVDANAHEVKIRKETFRNDQQFEECDSIQKVMQAWLQRFQLMVSFPTK